MTPETALVERRRAVIIVVYQNLHGERRVLSGDRPKELKTHGGMRTFPAGSVEPGEPVDKAFQREVSEELGIRPINYVPLTPVNQPLIDADGVGTDGTALYPHLITRWRGRIPDRVLDKQQYYPLRWESLDDAGKSPLATRRIIVDLVKSKLAGPR